MHISWLAFLTHKHMCYTIKWGFTMIVLYICVIHAVWLNSVKFCQTSESNKVQSSSFIHWSSVNKCKFIMVRVVVGRWTLGRRQEYTWVSILSYIIQHNMTTKILTATFLHCPIHLNSWTSESPNEWPPPDCDIAAESSPGVVPFSSLTILTINDYRWRQCHT